MTLYRLYRVCVAIINTHIQLQANDKTHPPFLFLYTRFDFTLTYQNMYIGKYDDCCHSGWYKMLRGDAVIICAIILIRKLNNIKIICFDFTKKILP